VAKGRSLRAAEPLQPAAISTLKASSAEFLQGKFESTITAMSMITAAIRRR